MASRSGDIGHPASEAREIIIRAIVGAGDRSREVADVLNRLLSRVPAATRPVRGASLDIIAETITGSVHAVAQVGEEVEPMARPIMIGALRGLRSSGLASPDSIGVAASSLVRSAAELNARPVETAIGAVQGAIAVAPEIDLSPEEVATAAAAGALRAAAGLGIKTLEAVRESLAHPISGIAIEIDDPFRSPGP